jgi:TPR repeat protein
MNQAAKTRVFRIILAVVLTGLGASAKADVASAKEAYKNQDYATAFKEFKALAASGDKVAQFYVGLMYDNGDLPQDYTSIVSRVSQAMMWYRKSAEQGFAPAETNLGILLETGGQITDRNYKEAATWYRKAADQGNAAAQFNLGEIYYVGRGDDIARDYKEAANWFRMSAEQGNSGAEIAYGRMYEYGQGMVIDYVQAYKWYLMADASGNQNAKDAMASVEVKMTPDQIEEAKALIKKNQSKRRE